MIKLILDAGHGWFTKGKESIFHKITSGLFRGKARLKENNYNEAICNKVSVLYDNSVFITNEWYDVTLKERIAREHKEHTHKSLFLSIHADAFEKKDTAEGGRFYYYSQRGKIIAQYMTNWMRDNGYGLYLRHPKQADFYVLKHSKSFAVLFEAGFMTSEHDLKEIEKETYRNKTSKLLNDCVRAMPESLVA